MPSSVTSSRARRRASRSASARANGAVLLRHLLALEAVCYSPNEGASSKISSLLSQCTEGAQDAKMMWGGHRQSGRTRHRGCRRAARPPHLAYNSPARTCPLSTAGVASSLARRSSSPSVGGTAGGKTTLRRRAPRWHAHARVRLPVSPVVAVLGAVPHRGAAALHNLGAVLLRLVEEDCRRQRAGRRGRGGRSCQASRASTRRQILFYRRAAHSPQSIPDTSRHGPPG